MKLHGALHLCLALAWGFGGDGEVFAANIEIDWIIPSDNEPYEPMEAMVGDTVTFNYNPGSHDVYIHPTGDCVETDRVFVGADGDDVYEFTEDDAGSTITFACDVYSHCELGQIVNFIVTATQDTTDDTDDTGDEDDEDDNDVTEDAQTLVLEPLGYPESVVAVADGYYVSQMAPNGQVLKYDLYWDLDDSFESGTLPNPRGLAVNSDGTKLWAACDNYVAEYTLANGVVQETKEYDTLSQGVEMEDPNGLCLSPDEQTLYFTSPDADTFAKIDLTAAEGEESVSVLFTDSAYAPNGCKVTDDNTKVWIINQRNGVTAYDIATDTMGGTESFSQAIVDVSTASPLQQQVGDGIVLYEGQLYASTWGASGIIWVCPLDGSSGDVCEEFLPAIAADISVDMVTPSAPQLLLPDLLGKKVSTYQLEHSSEPVDDTDDTGDEDDEDDNEDDEDDTADGQCLLCGEEWGEDVTFTNPDTMVDIPGLGPVPCAQVEQAASDGLIDANDCADAQILTSFCFCSNEGGGDTDDTGDEDNEDDEDEDPTDTSMVPTSNMDTSMAPTSNMDMSMAPTIEPEPTVPTAEPKGTTIAPSPEQTLVPTSSAAEFTATVGFFVSLLAGFWIA